MAQTYADPLEEGLALLGLVLVCSRRVIIQTCRSWEFMVKHSEKPLQAVLLVC